MRWRWKNPILDADYLALSVCSGASLSRICCFDSVDMILVSRRLCGTDLAGVWMASYDKFQVLSPSYNSGLSFCRPTFGGFKPKSKNESRVQRRPTESPP